MAGIVVQEKAAAQVISKARTGNKQNITNNIRNQKA